MPRIKGLRESAFWVLAGLSLILLLALMSYSPIDPAFSVAGGDEAVTNRMGPAGAWFADIAFLLFGASAYLFPMLVLIAGVFLFRGEELPEHGPMIWRGDRLRCSTIATSSGLATLHFQCAADARDGGRHSRPARRPRPRARARAARQRRCCCSCCGSAAVSARDRRVVDRDHGSHGPRRLRGDHRAQRARSGRRAHLVGRPAREAAAQRGREQGAREAEDRRAAHRAGRSRRSKSAPRASGAGARAPGAAVRAGRSRTSCRRCRCSTIRRRKRGRLLRRGARSDVAARRDQAQRLRRRGRGRGRAPGARRHAVRAQAAPRA